MTNLPEHRRQRSWLSELSDAVNGFNSWANLRPMFADTHLIRLEGETKDSHYLVHAEIPGIDPANFRSPSTARPQRRRVDVSATKAGGQGHRQLRRLLARRDCVGRLGVHRRLING